MSTRISYGPEKHEPLPQPKTSVRGIPGHVFYCRSCGKGTTHRVFLLSETTLRQECGVCEDHSDYVRRASAWWPEQLADALDEMMDETFAKTVAKIQAEQEAAKRPAEPKVKQKLFRRKKRASVQPTETVLTAVEPKHGKPVLAKDYADALRLAHGDAARARRILETSNTIRRKQAEEKVLAGVDDF